MRRYHGKLGLWAETRSGWLPVHCAFLENAPVHALTVRKPSGLEGFIPRMIQMMDVQLNIIKETLAVSGAASGAAASSSADPALQLPASAAEALGKKRTNSEGEQVLGPTGFTRAHKADTELLALIVNPSASGNGALRE